MWSQLFNIPFHNTGVGKNESLTEGVLMMTLHVLVPVPVLVQVYCRNSTVEMADDDQDCAICLEALTTPLRLPCGHTLDCHCLLRVLAQKFRESPAMAPCPCCRATFTHGHIMMHLQDNISPDFDSMGHVRAAAEEYDQAARKVLAMKREQANNLRNPPWFVKLWIGVVIVATLALFGSVAYLAHAGVFAQVAADLNADVSFDLRRLRASRERAIDLEEASDAARAKREQSTLQLQPGMLTECELWQEEELSRRGQPIKEEAHEPPGGAAAHVPPTRRIAAGQVPWRRLLL